MLVTILVITAIVGALTGLLTLAVNHIRPEVPTRKAMDRIVAMLAIVIFCLMMVGCGIVLQEGCAADDNVCDAPGMAALGVTMIGGLALAALIVVGIPVAYLVLKLVRRG